MFLTSCVTDSKSAEFAISVILIASYFTTHICNIYMHYVYSDVHWPYCHVFQSYQFSVVVTVAYDCFMKTCKTSQATLLRVIEWVELIMSLMWHGRITGAQSGGQACEFLCTIELAWCTLKCIIPHTYTHSPCPRDYVSSTRVSEISNEVTLGERLITCSGG